VCARFLILYVHSSIWLWTSTCAKLVQSVLQLLKYEKGKIQALQVYVISYGAKTTKVCKPSCCGPRVHGYPQAWRLHLFLDSPWFGVPSFPVKNFITKESSTIFLLVNLVATNNTLPIFQTPKKVGYKYLKKFLKWLTDMCNLYHHIWIFWFEIYWYLDWSWVIIYLY
jgi:hypothetical protein